MNIIVLLPLLAAIAYIPLVIITACTRPWLKQHLLFILFLISRMLWSIFSFLLRSDLFPDQKMLIFRLDICALLPDDNQFYYFVRYYLYRSMGWGIICQLCNSLGGSYRCIVRPCPGATRS